MYRCVVNRGTFSECLVSMFFIRVRFVLVYFRTTSTFHRWGCVVTDGFRVRVMYISLKHNKIEQVGAEDM